MGDVLASCGRCNISDGVELIRREEGVQEMLLGDSERRPLAQAFDELLGAVFDFEQTNHLLDVTDLDAHVPPSFAVRPTREAREGFTVVGDREVVFAFLACPTGGTVIQHRPQFFE